MGNIEIELILIFDVDNYLYILISKPRKLDRIFIDLLELLPFSYPQIECRFSGTYFKLFSKDYKALLDVTETVLEIIYEESTKEYE